MADDFVRACVTGDQPPVNAWIASRFTLRGIAVMESAKRNGERLPIADFGDGPAVTRTHK